jgi:hypothetical protein
MEMRDTPLLIFPSEHPENALASPPLEVGAVQAFVQPAYEQKKQLRGAFWMHVVRERECAKPLHRKAGDEFAPRLRKRLCLDY